MTDADIAAQLVAALAETAAREGAASLVSANIDMIGPAAEGEARAEISRRTRTLLFLRANYASADGARIATASSVHSYETEDS